MVEESEVVQPPEMAPVLDGERYVIAVTRSAAGTGGLDEKVAH